MAYTLLQQFAILLICSTVVGVEICDEDVFALYLGGDFGVEIHRSIMEIGLVVTQVPFFEHEHFLKETGLSLANHLGRSDVGDEAVVVDSGH
jgi:hypothetical protein